MKTHNRKKLSYSELEALYWAYIDSRGMDGEEICQCYQKLEQLLQELPWKKQNDVLCAVNELGAVLERIAFLDGIRSGAKLMQQLVD